MEVCRGLIMAFSQTVNIDNISIKFEELCNWVKSVCQHCPYDMSEECCIHQKQPLQYSEAQVQPTDEGKFRWIWVCLTPPSQDTQDDQCPTISAAGFTCAKACGKMLINTEEIDTPANKANQHTE
jgi:hypothetical protein